MAPRRRYRLCFFCSGSRTDSSFGSTGATPDRNFHFGLNFTQHNQPAICFEKCIAVTKASASECGWAIVGQFRNVDLSLSPAACPVPSSGAPACLPQAGRRVGKQHKRLVAGALRLRSGQATRLCVSFSFSKKPTTWLDLSFTPVFPLPVGPRGGPGKAQR